LNFRPTVRLAWPFSFAKMARSLVIGTFRRTSARLHEEKATSAVESLAYIAPNGGAKREEEFLIWQLPDDSSSRAAASPP
jgi:hypothetical protein